jgi:hypothetical protein
MIPTDSTVTAGTGSTELPSKTFYLDITNNKIVGTVDNIEAVKQAVYVILNTERFKHEILSWNFGMETKPVMGMTMELAMPEIKRYITEALIQDDRIAEVKDFSFSVVKSGVLAVSFTVVSNKGSFTTETEVSV